MKYKKIIIASVIVIIVILLNNKTKCSVCSMMPRSDIERVYESNNRVLGCIKDYVDNIHYSHIIPSDADELQEFILSFNENIPDITNKEVDIITSSGKIIYDNKNLSNLFYKAFFLNYKDTHILPSDLIINVGNDYGDCFYGYILAYYISPTGKIKNYYYDINGSEIILKNNIGLYSIDKVGVFIMSKEFKVNKEDIFQISTKNIFNKKEIAVFNIH